MSGIAGGWRLPDLDATAMLAALQHRGQGRQAQWCDAQAAVVLGHCRARGDDRPQPLLSRCGRYVLCLEGRLFNTAELAQQLDACRGSGDGALLLRAIVQWGLETALQRCVGGFALSLWDRQQQVLWLARDRLGERPLYYARHRGGVLFASELKALQAVPGFAPGLDRNALSLLLRYGYIPAPHSIYQGVGKLVAGQLLRVDARALAGGDIRAQSYWCAQTTLQQAAAQRPLRPGCLDTASDRLQQVLEQAVARRMHSPLATGAFLSGGTDSSLVVAMMQAQSALPVEAWTVGFDDAGHDESAAAQAVARHLGVRHHLQVLRPQQACQLLQRLPQVWCEPFADASQLPTLLASELLGAHKPVALTGDGGDELFFGHPSHGRALRNARWCAGLPDWLRRGLAAGAGDPERARLGGWPAIQAELRASGVAGHYLQRISRWREPALAILGAAEPGTAFHEAYNPGLAPGDQVQLLDLRMDLGEGILTKVDRAAMAAGVETRSPLLDPEVMQLAWSLPMPLKYHDGEHKRILKHLLARYLPAELVYRPKQGFGPPMAAWLAGPMREWAESLLDPALLHRQGVFDVARIRTIWAEFLGGRRKWHTHLWGVLMFQAWYGHWHGSRWRLPTCVDALPQA